MTPEFIAFHAAERPGAVALLYNGREITYAQFARDIPKFTQALGELALRRGARVAFDYDDVYVHWLMRIGFEELGVVAASLSGPVSPDAALLRGFDLILSGTEISSDAIRCRRIDPQWLERIFARTDTGMAPEWDKSPDEPMRMAWTSGTTASPKKLLFSRRNHENSIAKAVWINGFTRHSRNLVSMPLSVAGSYTNATACLRCGGTVVVESRMTLEQAIASHAITHATLVPIAVKDVLDKLSDDFEKPADFTIFTWGAPVSRTLRHRVLARLATDLCDLYGSNEAADVSAVRGTAEFGSVLPMVQVEIVDESHRPLPFGQMGEIRVKTDCMVDDYLDDPETTRRKFRDGWFYAGDFGILHDTHTLQYIGRSDDLLNIGFNKLSPDRLEDLVLRSGVVGDAGVCSLPNADGIEEVCVGITDARVDDRELLERLRDAFRWFPLGKFHVVKMIRIPRNANGKIQRDLLRSAADQSIRDR